jgi:hypothetical protein
MAARSIAPAGAESHRMKGRMKGRMRAGLKGRIALG